ncbi:hypothetical protein [Pedobacter caeni]|uniref:YD repeat-containing protein n=1 Tax=Pedobacter caeni TaxID=288992 RepID=A0A1M4TJ51_9SPHI|nr:hypothetical protein [Pedobacter caeni]SHE44438.1 hypothetical protein SAMN04488522_101212 [Pedobacter caeni]
MKRLILTISLLVAMFFNPLNAQVKKAVVKPKGKVESVKEPVFSKTDFFSQTPDGAVQIINDELKKLQITLKDIQETATYEYDVKGKKLNSMATTSRRLIFDKGLNASVVADKGDNITEISLELSTGNVKQFKSIKKMLGFAGWAVIGQTESDTTFRNGNLVGTSFSYLALNEDGEQTNQLVLALSMKRVGLYNYVPKEVRPFNAQDLSVYDNPDDIGYAIIEFMKKMGINLLYQDREQSFAMDGELSGYSRSYYFSNSVFVTINTSALWRLKSIDLTCKDPITFSRLKKNTGILQWPKTGSNTESNSDFYALNHIRCSVYSSAKYMLFDVKPLETDLSGRLENTKAPGFDDLASLYQSGPKEQVIRTISNNYVNGLKHDEVLKKWVSDPLADKLKFYFKPPNTPIAVCIFDYNVSLKDNNSTAMYLYSKDAQYLKNLLSQYQNSSFSSKYIYLIKMDGKVVQSPMDFDEIWFLDRSVRMQQLAMQEQKQADAARQKEQERLDEIEREKQKAARSMETLNKLGDFLLKTPKKKP